MTREWGPCRSHEVVEVPLGPELLPQPQDVGPGHLRVERRRSWPPRSRGSGPRSTGPAPGSCPRRSSPNSPTGSRTQPGLRVVRVQVDHAQDHVRQVRRALGVADDLLVVGLVEPQPAVALEGRVLPPHPVDQRDELAEDVRLVPVPVAELVLLAVEVLLLAGLRPGSPRRSRTAGRRCRSWPPGWPPGRAGSGTRPARRAGGTRAGCPGCSATGSAACTRGPPSASAR